MLWMSFTDCGNCRFCAWLKANRSCAVTRIVLYRVLARRSAGQWVAEGLRGTVVRVADSVIDRRGLCLFGASGRRCRHRFHYPP